MTKTAKMKSELIKEGEPFKSPNFSNGLSSGCTLLNLACTGRATTAFLPGSYYLFVGDSQSGKTFEGLTALAEATMNPVYDEYSLIYDAPEAGAKMDVRKFFGKRLAKRITSPYEGCSESLQMFYLFARITMEKRPCIYFLDSMDALRLATPKKDIKNRKAVERGDQEIGDYGDKAKYNSQNLPKLIHVVQKTGSILIIVSQTRRNIGFGSMFNLKTRSGGDALSFYADMEIWFSVIGKIKREIRGKKRVVGATLAIRTKKTRMTGKDRQAELTFYPNVGFDDTGSNVNFLIEEGHWKEKDGIVSATEFNSLVLNRENLIEYIERTGKERDLRRLVTEVWKDIEIACEVKRKPRYV